MTIIFSCLLIQHSVEQAENLIRQHEAFITTMDANSDKISSVVSVGRELINDNNYAADKIQQKADALEERLEFLEYYRPIISVYLSNVEEVVGQITASKYEDVQCNSRDEHQQLCVYFLFQTLNWCLVGNLSVVVHARLFPVFCHKLNGVLQTSKNSLKGLSLTKSGWMHYFRLGTVMPASLCLLVALNPIS